MGSPSTARRRQRSFEGEKKPLSSSSPSCIRRSPLCSSQGRGQSRPRRGIVRVAAESAPGCSCRGPRCPLGRCDPPLPRPRLAALLAGQRRPGKGSGSAAAAAAARAVWGARLGEGRRCRRCCPCWKRQRLQSPACVTDRISRKYWKKICGRVKKENKESTSWHERRRTYSTSYWATNELTAFPSDWRRRCRCERGEGGSVTANTCRRDENSRAGCSGGKGFDRLEEAAVGGHESIWMDGIGSALGRRTGSRCQNLVAQHAPCASRLSRVLGKSPSTSIQGGRPCLVRTGIEDSGRTDTAGPGFTHTSGGRGFGSLGTCRAESVRMDRRVGCSGEVGRSFGRSGCSFFRGVRGGACASEEREMEGRDRQGKG